jgi:hypothetical protein
MVMALSALKLTLLPGTACVLVQRVCLIQFVLTLAALRALLWMHVLLSHPKSIDKDIWPLHNESATICLSLSAAVIKLVAHSVLIAAMFCGCNVTYSLPDEVHRSLDKRR